MIVFVKKENKDYLTNSLHTIHIYDENRKKIASITVNQPFFEKNLWGTITSLGGVRVNFATKTFRNHMIEKYGGISLRTMNHLFQPKKMTRRTLEKIAI